MINECCRNFFCLTTLLAIHFFDVLLCEPGSSSVGAPGGPGPAEGRRSICICQAGTFRVDRPRELWWPIEDPFLFSEEDTWAVISCGQEASLEAVQTTSASPTGERQVCFLFCFFKSKNTAGFGTALPRSKYPSGFNQEPSTFL